MASKPFQLKQASTPSSKAVAKDWREADSRAERSRLIREALFKAAAETVGDVGYEQASVAMITQRAGVAHGTFYNHFGSRQDIFDKLLPAVGKEMLEHVREAARPGRDLIEKEKLGFAAFFSFLKDTPHFFRLLNEAESFAPKGYRAHLELISTGYIRFFERAHAQGELPGYEKREFEVIAFMLMAARSYLAWRFVYGAEQRTDIPDWVVEAYIKFVRDGLSSVGQTGAMPREAKPRGSRPRGKTRKA